MDIEHVRSMTGENLATQLRRAHLEIEAAARIWEGTPERFRQWATSKMRAALAAMGDIAHCDTPDNLIGLKECVPLVNAPAATCGEPGATN